MVKKIRMVIAVFVFVVFGFVGFSFFMGSNSIDKENISKTITMDAIYFENEGFVEITFLDKSQKTTRAVLEILGMPESFQKTYYDSQFVERVVFLDTPEFGWKSLPIVLVIDHQEFGSIGLKTEIHGKDEPAPKIIIYSTSSFPPQ